MPLPFNQESWIWYTCATVMIGSRLISRHIHLGAWKRLDYDDYIMGIFVTAAYTALIVCSNRYVKAQSNLLAPGFDYNDLTPEELSRRRYGSKMVVVVEQTQISVIWACKVCLLIMYHRLTRTALRNENIAIKLLSAYVATGFIIMEVLYFGVWCRPITEYWAVPTHSSQCNALINHRITKAVFNLSSDIIMLTIALQMLIRSLLPLKRKLVLCGIFSLGIFVIIASILNSYYSFKNPYKQTWTDWYVRESSTAILVANLPFTWTILRELFDVGSFDDSPAPWTFHSARSAHGRRSGQRNSHSITTATSARKYSSPTTSRGSHGTHPMTMVDSITPLKHSLHTPTTSPHGSEPDTYLSDDAIIPHDFATMPSSHAGLGAFDFDLEHGMSNVAELRPVSPTQSSTHQRFTEDGTGGFYLNDHPISPPSRAYLAARANRSRDSSISSIDRRPVSPLGSTLAGVEAGQRSVTGTGRSAHDRKTRARLSE